MTIFTAGSQWSKWDLHVHTPASFEHSYGAGGKDSWETFMREIEALPPEFTVIGINDYLFIDGYERVLQERAKGRMRNIALFLPVLEFRLDKFGGVGGAWSRVNFHVIFSNELALDTIKSQFIAGLSRAYAVDHDHSGVSWNSSLTPQSLEDLGRQVIAATPSGKRTGASPLRVGFNSYNVQFDEVVKLLNKPLFKGKVITCIGISEWNDLRWNESSIAEKKSIINSCDIVLTSCPEPEGCLKHRQSLIDGQVRNTKIIDGSDAHGPADAAGNALGKCHTWMKAVPTFEGLRQAIGEYEGRVALCKRPAKLTLVDSSRTWFIKSITLAKIALAKTSESWFNCTIPLNYDLVAIIGNKGNCKSALADAIGLAGNSLTEKYFSFLHKEKFRHPKDNKAADFTVSITWADGKVGKPRRLCDPVETPHDMVRYIPQNYFESLCSTIDVTGNPLEAELKAVIFRHIPEKDRLGHRTLDELIAFRMQEMQQRLGDLRSSVHVLNAQIRAKERACSVKSLAKQADLVALKAAEVEAHMKTKPKEMAKPNRKADAQEQVRQAIEDRKESIAKLKAQIKDDQKVGKDQTKQVAVCDRVLGQIRLLQENHERVIAQITPMIKSVGITEPIRNILHLTVNVRPLEVEKAAAQKLVDACDARVGDDRTGAIKKIADLQKEIDAFGKKLDAPQQKYLEHQKSVSDWNMIYTDLIGDDDTPDSLTWLRVQAVELEKGPAEISALKAERRGLMQRIVASTEEHLATLRSYYAPVQKFMTSDPIVTEARVDLNFDVSLLAQNFRDTFLGHIDKNMRSAFRGKEGVELMDRLIAATEFSSSESILVMIDAVEGHLYQAGSVGDAYEVDKIMKTESTSEALLDYLMGMSYLQPVFAMKMNGKHLRELSQGEKGAALLIFYLLVDKDRRPIIIDQPEENLDNQTIFTLLVPCIKRAKQERQIIMVTHNPNLAVVCDAEQIIYCAHEKTGAMAVTYTSGPLEDLQISRHVVNVLEGTMPAFNNRSAKYALRGSP